MTRSALLKCILLLSSAALLSACSKGPENKPIIIKFPHITAPSTPKGRTAERFRQLVAQRLAGRVKVEVYPSSQLMNDEDSIEALALGEIQMIAVSLSKFDRFTRKFLVFDLPFLFPNLDAVERFQDSPAGRNLLTTLAPRGILGLAYWHNGMKQFGAPRPLRRPQDARGLKFRIMESDVLQAQIQQIGGNPQKMAFGEVYQALQTGAVDAQENTWSNNYSSKFYEVQKYLMDTNHGYLGYLVAVNPKFWNELPTDIRTELTSILKEVTRWGNDQAAAINRSDKEKIAASGRCEIIELTDEELTAWRAAMRPVWGKFEPEIGRDLIDAALSASRP